MDASLASPETVVNGPQPPSPQGGGDPQTDEDRSSSPGAVQDAGLSHTYEVLLFASLRDAAGEKIPVDLPQGSTVAELLLAVVEAVPALAGWMQHIRVGVNCEYVDLQHALSPGDEIALLPPVSGGAGTGANGENGAIRIWVQVTAEPLDTPAIMARAESGLAGGAGAIVPFVGIVRNNARGQSVTHLEYQAYGAMAEAEMRRIAAEAVERWDCACAVAHRTGRLEIGEASLVVVVASAHRVAAFEACRWAVDEIKLRVPVWKKEFAANGTFWVEDPLQAPPGHPMGALEPPHPAAPHQAAPEPVLPDGS